LWQKLVYKIRLKGGRGQVVTNPIHGLIAHLIVIPVSESLVWSMKLIDKEGDEIYDCRDLMGRWDEFRGIPVGKDTQQKVTIRFDDCSGNEEVKVILKVREV
jgi:hypothetical protein